MSTTWAAPVGWLLPNGFLPRTEAKMMQKNTGVFIQTRAEMALELVWWLFLPTSQAWELHQCLRPDREVLEELRERKLGPHCVCDG